MRSDALAKLDAAHGAIADAFAAMPDAALAWLKPGVPHVQTLFSQWKMAADARR